MIIPVRCLCNRVIGHKWLPYQKLLAEGHNETEALNLLKLKSPCCRSTILTHVPLLDMYLELERLNTEEKVSGSSLNSDCTPRVQPSTGQPDDPAETLTSPLRQRYGEKQKHASRLIAR